MWWVYKCNATQPPYAHAWGDWNELFNAEKTRRWGSTKWVPKIVAAHKGDTLIAYQTDRNELVGLARVVGWRQEGRFQRLILKPLEVIRARVRPLKKSNPRIARIHALKGGEIKTLYEISTEDAKVLVRAARAAARVNIEQATASANRSLRGAGFGSAVQNRKVELVAMKFAQRKLQEQGWQVRDVSKENRGFDLLCAKGRQCLEVEVKGSRGSKLEFLITQNEWKVWKTDPAYAVALVTNVLTNPTLWMFRGARGFEQFCFTPVCFTATSR